MLTFRKQGKTLTIIRVSQNIDAWKIKGNTNSEVVLLTEYTKRNDSMLEQVFQKSIKWPLNMI
jgi:hypothetical protein